MFVSMRRGQGGPIPKFNDYNLWKAIISLDEFLPVGRKKLAGACGVGEGSMRTMLGMLEEGGLVTITKNGICLTEKGAEYRNMMYMEARPISKSSLTIGEHDCAVKVPFAAKRVLYGCEERDAAIMAGALGATTLICVNGTLRFPGSDFPVAWDIDTAIRERFRMRNEDAVIIGTGHTPEMAEKGAVTAAISLMGGLPLKRSLGNMLRTDSTANEVLSLAFAIHELVGGLPVCAKSRDNLGIRIENGAVVDNAYTGDILEEVLRENTTVRRVAETGPYKGIRVIVTPVEIDGKVVAAIGVVDIRCAVGEDSRFRLDMDHSFSK